MITHRRDTTLSILMIFIATIVGCNLAIENDGNLFNMLAGMVMVAIAVMVAFVSLSLAFYHGCNHYRNLLHEIHTRSAEFERD